MHATPLGRGLLGACRQVATSPEVDWNETLPALEGGP